jgi:hypothetical protein
MFRDHVDGERADRAMAKQPAAMATSDVAAKRNTVRPEPRIHPDLDAHVCKLGKVCV